MNLAIFAPRLIIPPVARRIHVGLLSVGSIRLNPDQAHHLRDVLRLKVGDVVEAFNDEGIVGRGVIEQINADAVSLRIERVRQIQKVMEITIASALPKGQRADWMIEKLSELGIDHFIPLATERSTVEPSGKNKLDRWRRIAVESAKQSRRGGVIRIEPLTAFDDFVKDNLEASLYLSTDPAAIPLLAIPESRIHNPQSKLSLLIGPEGGWSDTEVDRFRDSGLTGVRLTRTILRIETAAVAAAAIVASIRDSQEIP